MSRSILKFSSCSSNADMETYAPLISVIVNNALLLGVYTVRSSDRPVGPTQATSDCLSDQSDRPVGQTVAEPPT